MKKNLLRGAMAVMLGSCILFSSCIGSFGLTGKLHSWNGSIGSKFVNELVFLAFCIVPVYEISLIADGLVINSIEFWSGKNPVAESTVPAKIKGNNGEYLVQRTESGYHIQKEGESVATDLAFNEENQTWSVITSTGENIPLLKFNEGNEVVMYLPSGDQVPVELSKDGVLAFRDNVLFNNFALR